MILILKHCRNSAKYSLIILQPDTLNSTVELLREKKERRNEIIKLTRTIYPRIEKTTTLAVEFNDTYDSLKNFTDKLKNELPQQLSLLGEELATRIELEDQLINTLLTPVSESAAMLQ